MPIRLFAVVMALATLAGCASPSLDPQVKAGIKAVYVAPPRLPEAPSVVPPQGGAPAVAAGKAVPSGKEAVAKLKAIVDDRVRLSSFITAVAVRELQARGYRIVPSPEAADATVRFTVFHGLGVSAATSDARSISMTVNTEVVRNTDGKRLLFRVANLVDPDLRAKTRHERYEAWFEKESLTIEQYQLVADNLVTQSLRGM